MKKTILVGTLGIAVGLSLGFAYGRTQLASEQKANKYESKGVVSALLQREPLTRVGKVPLEKLVQDYKGKIDQQKVQSK